ncbi:MAG: hypothetical protein IPN76_21905 [Saprospiraceae bacterium]|nr:hypothetical protein [Saprospiraceae bacterium]
MLDRDNNEKCYKIHTATKSLNPLLDMSHIGNSSIALNSWSKVNDPTILYEEGVAKHLKGFQQLFKKNDFKSIVITPLEKDKMPYGFFLFFSKRKIQRLFPEDMMFLTQLGRECYNATRSAEIFTLHLWQKHWQKKNRRCLSKRLK